MKRNGIAKIEIVAVVLSILLSAVVMPAMADTIYPEQSFSATVYMSAQENYRKYEYAQDPYPWCYDCVNCPSTYQGLPFYKSWHPGGDGQCGCDGETYCDHTSQWYCFYQRDLGTFTDSRTETRSFSDNVNGLEHSCKDNAGIDLGQAVSPPITAGHNKNNDKGWPIEVSTQMTFSLTVSDTNPNVEVFFSNPWGSTTTTDSSAHLIACTDYSETPTPSPTPSPTPTPTPTPTISPTPSPVIPTPTSTPTEEPELSISQSSLKEEPAVGEEVLITIAILNKGKATAKNIHLEERVPSSISVSYVEGADKAGGLVYWNGELDPGEAHSITHTLRILEEKSRAIPVTVTYEDALGNERQQSAEIYLTAETSAQVTPTPSSALTLPDIPWLYIIILVAVVFSGIAIIVAVRRGGEGGGAEVKIEEN